MNEKKFIIGILQFVGSIGGMILTAFVPFEIESGNPIGCAYFGIYGYLFINLISGVIHIKES